MILLEADDFYADLGRRIRARRLKRHLTQQQLGSSLDPPTTRASIANIEAGKQRVLAHTLAQLIDVLKASVAELLPPASYAKPEVIRQQLAEELPSSDERVLRLFVPQSTHISKRRRKR